MIKAPKRAFGKRISINVIILKHIIIESKNGIYKMFNTIKNELIRMG